MNLEDLTAAIGRIDSAVWQPFAMPLVLVIVGGLLTVATGFVQIRRFPVALRMVMGGAFQKQAAGAKTITPSRIAMIVGMELMLNFAASSCCASVSTLPKAMSGCFSEERS